MPGRRRPGDSNPAEGECGSSRSRRKPGGNAARPSRSVLHVLRVVPGTDLWVGRRRKGRRAEPSAWRGLSGCTRRKVGRGSHLPPRSGSVIGSMSGQSGLVREDGPALAAFRRCTGQVYSEYTAAQAEVHVALPLWIGHGRSGKPASVPARGAERRFEQAKVRTAAEVRGEPGERRRTLPTGCSGVLFPLLRHGSRGFAGCAQHNTQPLVQHFPAFPP